MTSDIAISAIAALATLGVVARPWRLPEATWAVAGAIALVAFRLLPWSEAAQAVFKGADVYMFLVGMMLLSELARREGLFDYLAALCVQQARGSSARLFLLVYIVGTAVTVFMSNDATAVVLTPAVLAVSRKAKATALPYLLVCAFIANAASFVLPISKGFRGAHFALSWVIQNRLVTSALGGPRTLAQWNDYVRALDYPWDAEDEALIDSLVVTGHPSTPGYNDPVYPVTGRRVG